jgi:hypothetical protein
MRNPAIAALLAASAVFAASAEPPFGWFAGDPHVHCDCGVAGGLTVTPDQVFAAMETNRLAVVSLLADMGNGEVRDATRDLPRINGRDYAGSTGEKILHWDAEWHFDPRGVTFDRKAIGGHLILLGLNRGEPRFAEYTYPIIRWAKRRKAVVGLAHMQYLPEGVPRELDCCAPLEYPVEVALGAVDFLMEDVRGGETAIQAYYRLLNCGFRPGLAAATDFPCNRHEPIGTLRTYVFVPDGKLTYRKWIGGLAAGRTVVSRSAGDEFLALKVNGANGPGDEIALNGAGTVSVIARRSGSRRPGSKIELVHNGAVVASSETSDTLETTVEFPNSGWIAARLMDPNGHRIHTGAVFVTINRKPVRASAADALYFVSFIDKLIRETSPGGAWSEFFPHDRDAAQARYRRARSLYQRIAAEARRQ